MTHTKGNKTPLPSDRSFATNNIPCSHNVQTPTEQQFT